MGEYARYNGQRIKIGTCEDLYYLRASQLPLIQPERGEADPRTNASKAVYRFRFPWPDEDVVAPGAFDNPFRSVALWNVTAPPDLKHDAVQFVAQAGYNVSLPCPEGPMKIEGLKVHRNGFSGPVKIVQQAYRNGVLALICECGGCGAKYNLPTIQDAEPIIVACRAEADAADKRNDGAGKWWHAIADRIAAGYTNPKEG